MVFPLTMKMNPLYVVVCYTNTETGLSLRGHYPLHCTARSTATVPLTEANVNLRRTSTQVSVQKLWQHDSVFSTSQGCPMPVFCICFLLLYSVSTWLNGSTKWEAPLVTFHPCSSHNTADIEVTFCIDPHSLSFFWGNHWELHFFHDWKTVNLKATCLHPTGWRQAYSRSPDLMSLDFFEVTLKGGLLSPGKCRHFCVIAMIATVNYIQYQRRLKVFAVPISAAVQEEHT
jgi:hypothetical protein